MADNLRFENDKSRELDEAYRMGEHPISHWDKKLFKRCFDRYYPEYAERLLKLPVWYLQNCFLMHASWHRTGPYYKRTEFFKMNKRCNEKRLEEFFSSFKDVDRARRRYKRFEPYIGAQKPCKIVLSDGETTVDDVIIEKDRDGLAAYRIEELRKAMEKYNYESQNAKELYPELFHLLLEDIKDEYVIWEPNPNPYHNTLPDRTGYFFPKGAKLPKSIKVKHLAEVLEEGSVYFYVSPNAKCKYVRYNGRSLCTFKVIDEALVAKILRHGEIEFNIRKFLYKVTPYRGFDLYVEKKK